MAVCVKIKGKKRRLCAADLDRIITLKHRAIVPPADGSVDYTMLFTDQPVSGAPTGDTWAMIETVNGETIFDQNNIERTVTHKIYIRYDASVTAESWIVFEGSRIDILDVEDLDERHEWLLLTCNARGSESRSTTAQ